MQQRPHAYDLVIIGGGPGGATAAMYGARANLRTLVLDKGVTAGALGMTGRIENYPGLPAMAGPELVATLRQQAADFGAEFAQGQVIGVSLEQHPKLVFTGDGQVYEAKAIILASGAMGRTSSVPGEAELTGRGVSYCATCDAAFYRGQTVAVIGATDQAVEEALFVAQFADQVHLISPQPAFRATDSLLSQVDQNGKIVQHKGYSLRRVMGEDSVTGIVLRSRDGELTLPVTGVFLYLHGNKPVTDFLGDMLATDDAGYVIVDPYTMATAIPGVYAVGDLIRGEVRQAVIAAAQGSIAAVQAEKFVRGRKQARHDWREGAA